MRAHQPGEPRLWMAELRSEAPGARSPAPWHQLSRWRPFHSKRRARGRSPQAAEPEIGELVKSAASLLLLAVGPSPSEYTKAPGFSDGFSPKIRRALDNGAAGQQRRGIPRLRPARSTILASSGTDPARYGPWGQWGRPFAAP